MFEQNNIGGAMKAVLYLRSSKDRADLSIDAQRVALSEYAFSKGIQIVGEYSDAVYSGKDENRPGFQQMLCDLTTRGRGWDTVLVLDTSRIGRRSWISVAFQRKCEQVGVRVLYKSVPDGDPITGNLLKGILQAMDEWHSLVSKAKGMAGMAEAVRQGYRAGGVAPRGYRLEHFATDTIRDGRPVMRSRLVLSEEAPAVQAYLKARAAGATRSVASQASGISTSLADLEMRALTYAGHTVWCQTAERTTGGYVGGVKYRPRSEWKVTRNTHEALITEEEAEEILYKNTVKGRESHLLAGLVQTTAGEVLSCENLGGKRFYRLGRGPRISANGIESAVKQMGFDDKESLTAVEKIVVDLTDRTGFICTREGSLAFSIPRRAA